MPSKVRGKRESNKPGVFQDWTAVGNEPADLPVHPARAAVVRGRAAGELLVENVAGVAVGSALSAEVGVGAPHRAVPDGHGCSKTSHSSHSSRIKGTKPMRSFMHHWFRIDP